MGDDLLAGILTEVRERKERPGPPRGAPGAGPGADDDGAGPEAPGFGARG